MRIDFLTPPLPRSVVISFTEFPFFRKRSLNFCYICTCRPRLTIIRLTTFLSDDGRIIAYKKTFYFISRNTDLRCSYTWVDVLFLPNYQSSLRGLVQWILIKKHYTSMIFHVCKSTHRNSLPSFHNYDVKLYVSTLSVEWL